MTTEIGTLATKLEQVQALIAGYPVGPVVKKTVRWTLTGALRVVEPDGDPAWEAVRRAAALRGHGDLADSALLWLLNGEEGHAEMLAVLDKALQIVNEKASSS